MSNCDIYYLFREKKLKHKELIMERYPKLMKYWPILHGVLSKVQLFENLYPGWHEGSEYFIKAYKYTDNFDDYLPDNKKIENSDKFVNDLLMMTYKIPDEALPLLDEEFFERISNSYRHSILSKVKAILLPSDAANDCITDYLDNFMVFISDESHLTQNYDLKYNNLYMIHNKDLLLMRLAITIDDSHFIEFMHMILAYYYAHLEDFDYNIDNIDIIINRFISEYNRYLLGYQEFAVKKDNNFTKKEYVVYDNYSIYSYLERIIPLLAKPVLTDDELDEIPLTLSKCLNKEMTYDEVRNYLKKYGVINVTLTSVGIASVRFIGGYVMNYCDLRIQGSRKR